MVSSATGIIVLTLVELSTLTEEFNFLSYNHTGVTIGMQLWIRGPSTYNLREAPIRGVLARSKKIETAAHA